jgi:molybdopterin synthase catalytic subunit
MITVTKNKIPVEETINSLRSPDCGAVMSYLGTVRSYLDGKQSKGLSFEVPDDEMYRSLEAVAAEAVKEFDIKDVAVVHRTGSFATGDAILLIAISSGHRGPAFEACAYIIDRIKELHEVWKREELED